MTTSGSDQDLRTRYNELMKKKKKISKRMEGLSKKYVIAKVEKKRVSQEINRIAQELKKMHAEDPQSAKDRMLKEITAFNPEDLFPQDLEKEFDQLEKTRNKKNEKMVEINDYIMDGDSVLAKPPSDEDDLELREQIHSEQTTEEEIEDLDKETRERLLTDTELGFDEGDTIVGEDGETYLHDE